MKDIDLIAFLKRGQAALRKEGPGVIVVKENVCQDGEGGVPAIIFDKDDSSVMRYFFLSPPSCLESKHVV
jgi:protein N-terminal methyltransferase